MLNGLTDSRIDSGEFARDLPPIRFLRHHQLKEDLGSFLREMGYSTRRIERACGHPPVNVSQGRRGRPWQDFYTPAEEALKRHRERALFRMFPEFAE